MSTILEIAPENSAHKKNIINVQLILYCYFILGTDIKKLIGTGHQLSFHRPSYPRSLRQFSSLRRHSNKITVSLVHMPMRDAAMPKCHHYANTDFINLPAALLLHVDAHEQELVDRLYHSQSNSSSTLQPGLNQWTDQFNFAFFLPRPVHCNAMLCSAAVFFFTFTFTSCQVKSFLVASKLGPALRTVYYHTVCICLPQSPFIRNGHHCFLLSVLQMFDRDIDPLIR